MKRPAAAAVTALALTGCSSAAGLEAKPATTTTQALTRAPEYEYEYDTPLSPSDYHALVRANVDDVDAFDDAGLDHVGHLVCDTINHARADRGRYVGYEIIHHTLADDMSSEDAKAFITYAVRRFCYESIDFVPA